MTHDELKIKLRDMPVNLSNSVTIYDALLAVIDLHEPYGDIMCVICEGVSYPCSTIQAIEKELNG